MAASKIETEKLRRRIATLEQENRAISRSSTAKQQGTASTAYEGDASGPIDRSTFLPSLDVASADLTGSQDEAAIQPHTPSESQLEVDMPSLDDFFFGPADRKPAQHPTKRTIMVATDTSKRRVVRTSTSQNGLSSDDEGPRLSNPNKRQATLGQMTFPSCDERPPAGTPLRLVSSLRVPEPIASQTQQARNSAKRRTSRIASAGPKKGIISGPKRFLKTN